MRASYLIPACLIPVYLALAACGGENSTAPVATAPAVPPPALSDLPAPWNSADLASGKAAFGKCRSCHTTGAGQGNLVGPNLHGVFDRHPGSAQNFRYSAAMQAFAEEKWTPDLVDHWLSKPKDFLPGTSMFFDGIANENERRDLIGFLLIESRK